MSAEPWTSELDTAPERHAPPQHAHFGLLSQVEVIGIREGGLVDCWVPTELIDHEEVPVKEEWVDSLAADMRAINERDGGSGQLTPIILGEIEGEETLKIIDGFHRDASLKRNGEERIYATIKQTDWDELFDLRIFTAKDHAHVRFSRVVSWIREVWALTEMSEQLSVEQAVLLYRFKTDGSKLGLDADVVAEAKAWAERKEQQWQMKAMTIHSHLKIAEHVDPALVHSTREKKDGKTLDAPTQAIIKIFSEELPDNFPMQNLVMSAAMQRNLTGPKVKALCKSVGGYETVEAAAAFISDINWDTWEPAYGETTKKALRRRHDPRYKGGAVLATAATTIENVIERVDASLSRDEEVTPVMAELLQEAQGRANELVGRLGDLSTRLAQLRGREATEEPDTPPIERRAVVAKPKVIVPDRPKVTKDAEAAVPEATVEPTSFERHEEWGLSFKTYEEEAPTVSIKGNAQYGLSDQAAALLYVAAEEEPGTRMNLETMLEKLKDPRFGDLKEINSSAVRRAIREINDVFRRYGTERQLIMIFSGQKSVHFGLMD